MPKMLAEMPGPSLRQPRGRVVTQPRWSCPPRSDVSGKETVDSRNQVPHGQNELRNRQRPVTRAKRPHLPAQLTKPRPSNQPSVERGVAPSIARELLVTALPVEHYLQPDAGRSREHAPLTEHTGRAERLVHVPEHAVEFL